MPRQIQGSQTDFSFGEVDVELKRNDGHPAHKAGMRQLRNARIRNSGPFQNRPGRRALYLIQGGCTRIEKFTIAAGHNFKISFGNSLLQIIDSTETVVGNVTTQGNGAALPWTTATLKNVVYTIFQSSITITFPGMHPQVVSWDGTTWTRTDYSEMVIGGAQKRTPFYRISPQGISLLPSAQTGVITLIASAPLFTLAWVGTRIRFVGRQILISGFTDSTHVTATVEESLPGSQVITFLSEPTVAFNVGDEVIGSVSGSKGIVVAIDSALDKITVQLISTSTSSVGGSTVPGGSGSTTVAFVVADYVSGPGGTIGANAVAAIDVPKAVTIWDDEIMNDLRGYPASCFSDQFRVGFCNFPSVPGGIAWTAINSPTDLYVGPNPSDAMFEIAPAKTQVYYVVPGPEGSEFVFCDNHIYYIPISETNPLKPGSVAFKIVSGDGAAQVQPRLAQELILYVNAGQNSMMAIIATGAQQRPFSTKNLSDYHSHLFNAIVAIAVPNADGAFNERYAYVLNGDGSIAVGKYSPDSLQTNIPMVGWVPWQGAGIVHWIAAWNPDVFFTSLYGLTGIFEVLDDSKYLDCNIAVNAAPASFAPGPGQGPLWFLGSQTVTLIDQGTRVMGFYAVDANGFIVPQFAGGEDLTLASLMAGQPWTMTAEPFAPDAQPGADMGQRMKLRQISQLAAYVLNSTGFAFRSLFSAKQTATSPALGTAMNERRVPAWNVDDDSTKPPPLRETVETWPPPGSSFDPRVAIVKDTPGPLEVLEIAMEITL